MKTSNHTNALDINFINETRKKNSYAFYLFFHKLHNETQPRIMKFLKEIDTVSCAKNFI